MLDSVTKKKIDDLRNILVGKIPSPQSQVEQITTGLIYKFMYDMDSEAVQMGGVPSFFVNDYEKYSWEHLFDPKLGGADKVQLYSDAIENMYTNPSAPMLFREIFKNSFLPFKDPSTLNMFLKEINEFHYSHSEKLGDAFEYLLSFMGSQGDAGQFRTPRHIIDFIVEIVNPQKNETILDPACGTAGFLISSYKHILSQNTAKNLGDKLNASDRKQVCDNLVGYDISPDMTRISLVNMYLHQFASPQIHEYDTLSSEDRWNEYYDVILANPPFFSPTGGIQPHSRFGVKSTRAEVLFVDYVMEHLKPTGRAGIIVPEGIIFQTGTAYKNLRKKLIEDSLVGVISLPAGVFQPYSGVKTSILILDKELNQKSDSIFFAKVENDGFSLGAQRRPINKDDLPTIKQEIHEIFTSTNSSPNNMLVWSVEKSKVQNEPNYLFSSERYKTVTQSLSVFDIMSLDSVCESIEDGDWIESKDQSDRGIRLVQTGNIGIGEYLDKPNKARFISLDTFQRLNCRALKSSNVLVSRLPDPVGRACHAPSLESDSITSVDVAILECDESKLIPNYFIFLSQSVGYQNEINRYLTGASRQRISKGNLKKIEIPVPPIEIQQEIVEEIEGYQKIINGCKQVIENYKPSFEIDPSWEMVELGKLAYLKYGLGESAVDEGTHRFIRITDINEFGLLRSDEKKYASIDKSKEEYLLKKNDILIARTGATYGKCLYFEDNEPSIFAGYLIKVSLNERVIPKFFWIFSQSNNFDIQKKQLVVGGGQPQFNANTLKKLLVPVPPIHKQQEIIEEVLNHQKIVKGNINLMNHFQNKITEKINKIFGK